MVRDYLKKLGDPLKIDKCYKCPFVERGRCYGYEEGHKDCGRKLSKVIYLEFPDRPGGCFTDTGKRDINCPLPVRAEIVIEGT